MKYILSIILLAASSLTVFAQDATQSAESTRTGVKGVFGGEWDGAVYSTRFRDNWNLQFGLDMNLQHPHSNDDINKYDFSESIKKGRSFGIDVAVGHWFTPEIGLRGRVNWENGIPFFGKNRAEWLAPFSKYDENGDFVNNRGKNMEKGGYIVINGDIMFDVHNIFFGYKPNRLWNLQVYPRAGVVYNFGCSKGSPLIGIGIGNTMRINKRLKIYADATFNGVSSGFTGDKSTSTGTGSSFNGFFDINAGVVVNLGNNGFDKVNGENTVLSNEESVVLCRSFWDNWFVQAGLDMSLQFPYDMDYSHVFSKGRSFGIDVAVGRWFSPVIGVRAKMNWENGFPLFKNKKIEWIATDDSGKTNMQKGGYIVPSMDVMISIPGIFCPYKADRRWNPYAFGRLGLGCNLAINSCSPLIGIGVGTTCRVSKRVSLYADAAYQSITSEFFGDLSTTGMSVSTKHNSFTDFNLGVQVDLGKSAGKFK